jgi:hypothetical protein
MPQFQLYDLDRDIRETINIIQENPRMVNKLKKLLAKHILEGRSTPGSPQKNDGAEIWDTIKWLEAYM